jgi:poly-gamma-glutamate capsule biosynthesis protein CapA/YwtB (metallophosphatase superfamily)
VTIALGGDVHFEGPLRDRLADPPSALDTVAPLLSGADLAVVNLESSVGTGGTPEPKRFRFQAPPTALDALAAAGVDVVTMANNHAKDFGDDGFAQTLAAATDAEAGAPPLSVVGVGADVAAAFAPAVREVRGTTVAVIGAHSADDPTADPTAHWAASEDRPGVAVTRDDLGPLVDAVRETARRADIVIVFMHWGVQGESCPSESQRATARALADAGATAVVGSHAHELQGTGLLDATYVAYGLGNLVWYRPGPTGVLTLTVLDGRVAGETWIPAEIGTDGLPVAVQGAEAERLSAEFAGLRDCTDLAPLG